jgi:hypothetical protein
MRLTGPGKVWLQSLSLPMLASALAPYLPQASGPATNGSMQGAAIGGGIELGVHGISKLF